MNVNEKLLKGNVRFMVGFADNYYLLLADLDKELQCCQSPWYTVNFIPWQKEHKCLSIVYTL